MQSSAFNPLYDSIKLIQDWYEISDQELNAKPVPHKVLKKLCDDTETLVKFLKNPNNLESNKINKLSKSILKEINRHSVGKTELLINYIVKNTHNKFGKHEAFLPFHHLLESIQDRTTISKKQKNILESESSLDTLKYIDSTALTYIKKKIPFEFLENDPTGSIHSYLDGKHLLSLSLTSKSQHEKVKSLIPKLLNSGEMTLKSLGMKIEDLKKFIGKEKCAEIWKLDLTDLNIESLDESSLGHFPNLAHLSIIDCKKISQINLKNFPKITVLSIVGCDKINLIILNYFDNLKELDVQNNLLLKAIALGRCQKLSNIRLENNPNLIQFELYKPLLVKDFGFLKDCPIKALVINGFEKLSIKNLNLPQSCQNIEMFNLNDCNIVEDLDFLENFPNIQQINLKDCKNKNLDGLKYLKKLNNLNLEKCTQIEDFNFFKSFKKFKYINFKKCIQIKNFNFFKNCDKTENLDISFCKIKEISFLENFSGLKEIDLSKCLKIEDFTYLKFCQNLEKIILNYCLINDVSFFESLINLKYIILYKCNQISDFSYLKFCHNAKHIDLSYGKVNELNFLEFCPNLEALFLAGCTLIKDLSFLEFCPNLEVLYLTDCIQIEDFNYLKFCQNLDILYLDGCNIKKLDFLEPCQEIRHISFKNCKQLPKSFQNLMMQSDKIADFRKILGLPNLEYIITVDGKVIEK